MTVDAQEDDSSTRLPAGQFANLIYTYVSYVLYGTNVLSTNYVISAHRAKATEQQSCDGDGLAPDVRRLSTEK